MTDLAIQTEGLTKRLGDAAVVDKLDLAVPRGSVYGFLGPNGSGKTTTIRMLLGLIWPTAGAYRVLGEAMPAANAKVLPQVGALIEGPAFYPWLTGRQNLRRMDAAALDGQRKTRRERIDTALTRVGLAAAANKRFRAYSLGMKQRLGLAAALLRPRSLLILDEPTNGMDPQGTREIRNLVRELAGEGSTVFLSSHLLAEVELICTRAAMMANGKLVAQDRVDALLAPTGRLRIESPDASEAAAFLRTRHMTVEWLDQHHLRVHLNGEPAEAVNSMLVGQGLRVRELARERPTLEDVFLGLTGGVPSEPSAEPLPSPLPSPVAPPSGEDRPSPTGSVVEDGS